MSPISSMSHRSAMFSYFVWNLGNSEILAQKLCIEKIITNAFSGSFANLLSHIFRKYGSVKPVVNSIFSR